MCSTPVEVPAALRARWLAEVAETLEQADRLLNRLEFNGHHAANLVELAMRIDAAKHEVELLRMGRKQRAEVNADWINLPPWKEDERRGV